MAQTIQIKRSTGTASPTSLANGELAYSSNSNILYVGRPGGGTGDIDAIGGKLYIDMLDHTAGTLTASSAIVVDASSKIDILNIDNLTLDGNTLSSTNTNGDITLDPNGSGDIILDAGQTTITGDLTVQGTTTTVNTETILLADNIITLNSNYAGSSPSENGGIEIERGTADDNVALRWNETSDTWELTKNGTDYYEIQTVGESTYATSIGNGSDTSYTVTHNLGSQDVIVQLYDNSSLDTVYADVVRTSTSVVTIDFASAPTTNDIRVLITKIG